MHASSAMTLNAHMTAIQPALTWCICKCSLCSSWFNSKPNQQISTSQYMPGGLLPALLVSSYKLHRISHSAFLHSHSSACVDKLLFAGGLSTVFNCTYIIIVLYQCGSSNPTEAALQTPLVNVNHIKGMCTTWPASN